jgi:hypothetical protein
MAKELSPRQQINANNNAFDISNFDKDVELWLNGAPVPLSPTETFDIPKPNLSDNKPGKSPIQHHIEQFSRLSTQGRNWLVDEYDRTISPATPEDREIFIAFLNGTLSSQWAILRQLALQRLEGSPYKNALESLDDRASACHFCLQDALAEPIKNAISNSPPMINLGFTANITMFSDNAPSVIGLPFGAVQEMMIAPGEKTAQGPLPENKHIIVQGIAHEVSHSVFNSIPHFFCELKTKLNQRIAAMESDKVSTAKQILIWRHMMPWLNEMVADLSGTAFGSFEYATSARLVFASPFDDKDAPDPDHPITILRPWIHFWLLERLVKDAPEGACQPDPNKAKDDLEAVLDQSVRRFLNKRHQAITDLVIIRIKDVRDELEKFTNAILDEKLDALGGEALYTVLLRLWKDLDRETKHPVSAIALYDWGDEKIKRGPDQFILKQTSPSTMEHSLPITWYNSFLCNQMHLKEFCS